MRTGPYTYCTLCGGGAALCRAMQCDVAVDSSVERCNRNHSKRYFKRLILNILECFPFYSEYLRKGGIALFLFRVKNGDSYQIVPPDLLPKSSLSKYRGGVAFFLLREKYIDWERETEGE